MVQPSHPYMTTGKTIALTRWTFVGKVMSLLFNMLSESEVTQLCPTLCDPMDYILPGSSIHGIFQTRILEWVAISFPRGSSQHRDWTQVSHSVGSRFTVWAKMLSRLIITFLPRSKCVLISWLQSPSAAILESPKTKSEIWEYQTTWPASWEMCM